MLFDRYQIVDDSWNVWHPVDDVLTALDRQREDALPAFRYAEDATIGAIAVEGIDGSTLLKAFVDEWNAPAIIARSQRQAAGTIGWALAERGGGLTVVYRRANVVYLVSAPDPAKLEAILSDMPPGGA